MTNQQNKQIFKEKQSGSSSIMDQLKKEYDEWLISVQLKRAAYLDAKIALKSAESKLRITKTIFNRSYNEWKQSREEALRAKRRIQNYPYRIRRWALENIDKVLKMFEETSCQTT